MASMRAWVVDGTGPPAEVLELRQVEVPDPPPGFLRLRVGAAAIGLPDVLMCRGHYPLAPDGPFTPGQEIVGTVTAVGDGVDPGLIGTRRMGVTAFYLGSGGFAEQALAPEATMFPAPDWLADPDAAGFHIPFMTAWVGLHDRAALVTGEHLVVLGADVVIDHHTQEVSEAVHREILPMLADGSLTSLVTEHVSFEGLPAALTLLADRSAVGKYVLVP